MTRNKKAQALLFVLTAALIAFAPSRPVAGQAQNAPTFTKDVAPILQRSWRQVFNYEEVKKLP